MIEVGVARTFHALHQLEQDAGAEAHEHEHDYRVEAVVRGDALDEAGMLLDLDVLGAALADCLRELDSTDLDSLSAFADRNTTVEVVAEHIWQHVGELVGAAPADGSRTASGVGANLQSLRVTVYESAEAWASVDRSLR